MGSDSRNSNRACVGNSRDSDQTCDVDEKIQQRAWAELVRLFATQSQLEQAVQAAKGEM